MHPDDLMTAAWDYISELDGMDNHWIAIDGFNGQQFGGQIDWLIQWDVEIPHPEAEDQTMRDGSWIRWDVAERLVPKTYSELLEGIAAYAIDLCDDAEPEDTGRLQGLVLGILMMRAYFKPRGIECYVCSKGPIPIHEAEISADMLSDAINEGRTIEENVPTHCRPAAYQMLPDGRIAVCSDCHKTMIVGMD